MAEKKEVRTGHEALLDSMNDRERFSGKNEICVTELGDGWAVGEMQNVIGNQNPMGGVHGGALVTLADTVAGGALCTTGKAGVTLSSSMDYLRGAVPGTIRCVATVRKAGKTITVCDTVLTDSAEREVACGTYTFYTTRLLEPPFWEEGEEC